CTERSIAREDGRICRFPCRPKHRTLGRQTTLQSSKGKPEQKGSRDWNRDRLLRDLAGPRCSSTEGQCNNDRYGPRAGQDCQEEYFRGRTRTRSESNRGQRAESSADVERRV